MTPQRAPTTSDSSGSRGSKARAGESRFFQGPGLGIQVLGRARGYGAPARALEGLLGAYRSALGLEGASLTLMLVDGTRCRGLNRRFRGLDRSTDVLSFPSTEGPRKPGFDGYLGDMALCPPYAWAHRGRFYPDFGAESAFLVLHGLLHLSGRHHDSPAQERALWRLSLRLHRLSPPWHAALRGLRPLKRDPKP